MQGQIEGIFMCRDKLREFSKHTDNLDPFYGVVELADGKSVTQHQLVGELPGLPLNI